MIKTILEYKNNIIHNINIYKFNFIIIFISVFFGIVFSIFGSNDSLYNEKSQKEWILHSQTQIQMLSNVNTILTEPIFGGKPEIIKDNITTKKEISEGKWKIIGIIQDGQQRFALINDIKKGKITPFEVGDIFPNGEVLLEINVNSISVQNDNKIRVLTLFNNKIIEGK